MQTVIPMQVAHNSRYSQNLYIDDNNLPVNNPEKYLTQLINLNTISYNRNHVAKGLSIYPYDVIDNKIYFIIDPGILLIDTVFFTFSEYNLIDITNYYVNNVEHVVIFACFDKQIDQYVTFKALFEKDNKLYNENGTVYTLDIDHMVCIGIFKLQIGITNLIEYVYHNHYDSEFEVIHQKLNDNLISNLMTRQKYLKIVLDSDIKLYSVIIQNLEIKDYPPLSVFEETDWDIIFKIYGRWYSSSKHVFPQSLPFRNSHQRRLNTIGVFQ